MKQAERQALFENIVRLRRAERRLPGDRDVGAVRVDLERSLGETVPQAFAARVLGISHTALGRWVARGAIPIVVTADGRKAIPVASLSELYEAVEREREAGRRHALEAVVQGDRDRADRLQVGVLLGDRERPEDPHRAAELRNLAYHRAIARRHLDRAAADDALVLVRRWRERGRIDPRYADAWEEILVRAVPDIRKALEGETQHAHDLRQNSPFAGLLSESERRKIIEQIG